MRFFLAFCSARRTPRRWLLGCLLSLCLLPFLLLNSSPSLPASFFPYPSLTPSSSCPNSSFLLHPSGFCISSCFPVCFPRILRLCFYSSQVKICKESIDTKKLSDSHGTYDNLAETLSIMRFHGERRTLPVVHASCGGHKQWIRGLAMVADQRFLPYRKPNPHHEAEKLIPVLLMREKLGLTNSTLYWFSTKQDISEWALGFLKATNMYEKVHFLDLPERQETAVCFEDAVVFSASTNLRYIPDRRSNEFLRELVLKYCSISRENSSWPVRSAVILDRHGGTRKFANKQLVAEIVHKVLNVSVKQGFSGVGSFCDQVQAVVRDDLLIVPHGSQNTNLIFARPGTIVIEVFPYLFYTNALRNYTNAAGLQVYAILGRFPGHNLLMWLFSLIGWDACYYHFRWCKNYARRQSIIVDTSELERLLINIARGNSAYFAPLRS